MVADGIGTKRKRSTYVLLCLVGMLLCHAIGCCAGGEPVQNEDADTVSAASDVGFGTDIYYTDEHEDITTIR